MLTQIDPIVQAPMAGGISTPAMAVAVSDAGGLGFIGAGLLSPAALAAQLRSVRDQTSRPFGVNLFFPAQPPADPAVIAAYAERLRPLAAEAGAALGEPTHDDDDYEAKLAIVLEQAPPVVSFAFGCPPEAVIRQLQVGGSEVWITVTDAEEARAAADAGADAVIAQGAEAGGHRGSWRDDDRAPLPLLELVRSVSDAVSIPVIAAGGLMSGAHVAEALAAGAEAAQLGTAFLLTPEAGTSPAHRRALLEPSPTTLTRAFTGRRARAIINRWVELIGEQAPSAYPEVMHLTAPLRACGAGNGDVDLLNLWAGERHAEALELPAGEIVRRIVAELGAVGGH